jgi:peptidoglycan/xylan/chitin deacetylase (PgdA/CDA1 family)
MRKLYELLRKIFPAFLNSLLTMLLYDLKLKPTVNPKIKSPYKKGIIVFSADFEMAWAFRYSKTKGNEAEQMGLRERANVPVLLELFKKFRIPVTWATVGHLFLESCSKNEKGVPHSDMPRPEWFTNKNWCFESGDWYQHDPCQNYKDATAWYAPDLIDLILNSKTDHEIGCHTFSHIDCTEKNCPSELLRAELELCIRLAREKGIRLKTMIFPGGTNGNYDLIRQLGFTSFRKSTNYHLDVPSIDKSGLVRIPSSYSLERSNQNWSASRYIRMARSFVRKAEKSKLVAHLWFHPSLDNWYIENVLPALLDTVRKSADEGKVEILTMQQLAERTLANTEPK